jgi:hypothetical protein
VKRAVGTPGTERAEGTKVVGGQKALRVALAAGWLGDGHVERIGDCGRGS